MSKLILLLGDQLFDGLPGMPVNVPIWMREDGGLLSSTKHHKQKLVLFFSAMRHFAVNRSDVIYHRFDPLDRRTYLTSLEDAIAELRVTELYVYRPADEFILREVFSQLSVNVHLIDNPMFLVSLRDWQEYRDAHSRLLMNDFYICQRKKHRYLVDTNKLPEGGKWSFDAENRRKLPKNVIPPVVESSQLDQMTREVIQEVDLHFPKHPGRTENFSYPVTRASALRALEQFLDERLEWFGAYEDAISQRERTVYHSVLSPLLNLGLLTPREVLDSAIARDVPLNSKEGFVRQILGWREFVHHLNREYDPGQLPNRLQNSRRLADCWWNGSTGLPPLDCAINRVNEYGWCHHIERLMIIGSVMVMCDVHIDDSYRWFMEMFVDSAEWVMLPNVVGMSQFADGASFATKPYVSSSNYILKMSDWKKGAWCDTWDGLYWRFLQRHRSLLQVNPRMAPMYQLLDKINPARSQRLVNLAERFIERVTIP